MTLILSVIAPDYVLQACDRRLVFFTPKIKVKEDTALKAVLFNYHTAFGYTGLAELPRSRAVAAVRDPAPAKQPTNVWLAEVLTLGDDLQGALHHLLTEAPMALARLPSVPLNLRRQAFVGVGWMNREPGGPLEAALYEVHNFDDVRSFRLNIITLGDVPYGSHSSLPLPSAIAKEHDRLLADCMRRGLGPAAVGRVMVDTIRKVARVNTTVGAGVVQTCIPRAQVERVEAGGDWAIGAGEPHLEHMTFRHCPSGSDDGYQHGPTVVLQDKSIFAQLSFGPNANPLEVNRSPRTDG